MSASINSGDPVKPSKIMNIAPSFTKAVLNSPQTNIPCSKDASMVRRAENRLFCSNRSSASAKVSHL
ncbi:MAG: hypothetical protein Q8P24_05565, partial [Desulfobacterales bacterium]|nr:hypothetical protein [Desulfobacterales bacterium]